MFPWERRQMEGSGQLRTWEKVYWGLFVGGMAVLLYTRLLMPEAKKPDPKARARPPLLRAALPGVRADRVVKEGTRRTARGCGCGQQEHVGFQRARAACAYSARVKRPSEASEAGCQGGAKEFAGLEPCTRGPH